MSIGQKLWSPSHSQIYMASGCFRFAKVDIKFYRRSFSNAKVKSREKGIAEKGNSCKHAYIVAIVSRIAFVHCSRNSCSTSFFGRKLTLRRLKSKAYDRSFVQCCSQVIVSRGTRTCYHVKVFR